MSVAIGPQPIGLDEGARGERLPLETAEVGVERFGR